jgi:glycosyltransferase involved in cell wall biosynthesis
VRIDQVCAGFLPGDAISDEAVNIRKLLCSWGYKSSIYSWPPHIHPKSRRECEPIANLRPSASDILICHFSIGSPVTEAVLKFAGKKILIYHNITPSHYFRPYSWAIAEQLEDGRKQLAALRDCFDLALADSQFNREELDKLGFRQTGVLPILFDPARLPTPSPSGLPFLRKSGTVILFVGRLVPNKRAEDLIKIFDLYRRFYEPQSQLVWVGGWGGVNLYYWELKAMIQELGIPGVTFAGYLPAPQLAACFERGDVFACTSEHEGFCVPILESFHYGKPIVAYAGGAIPETVADAGLVLSERNPVVFAQAIDRVARDQNLTDELRHRGRQRLSTHFGFARVADLLRGYLGL